MSVIAIVLLAAALALVVAAEWPRLRERAGSEIRAERKRQARRDSLRVIEGGGGDPEPAAEEPDDFAASVQRDLDQLPVIDDRDLRRR